MGDSFKNIKLFVISAIVFFIFIIIARFFTNVNTSSNDISNEIVKSYLENFGLPGYRTSWYTPIEKISVKDKDVTIIMDIYPDKEGQEISQKICKVILFLHDYIQSVEIHGQKDTFLTLCVK